MRPFQRPQAATPGEGSAETDRVVATQGNIETVRQDLLTGWALALVTGRQVPLLEVRILHESGAVLAQGHATGFRADVQAAGLPTGWCGFTLPLLQTLPGEGLLTLQALVDGTWHLVSQSAVEAVPGSAAVLAADSRDEYFADILTVFAEARVTSATVGHGTLHLGRDIWVQASSSDVDRARVRLRLEQREGGGDEHAYVSVSGTGGALSRVDTRFRLGRSIEPGSRVALTVAVRLHASGDGIVRLNVFAPEGRTALAAYRVPAGKWVDLAVAAGPIAAAPVSPDAGPEGDVWVEVVASSFTALDIGQISVLDDSDSAFECVRVNAQSSVLLPVDGAGGEHPFGIEDFTVVIPFHGRRAYTRHCLDAVLANSHHRPHIVLVDDGTGSRLGQGLLGGLHERIEIVSFPENRGYTAAVNAGVRAARTDKVVILNNDTRVLPGWDVPLLAALDDEAVWAAGPLSNAASYQSVPEQRSGQGWAVNELPRSVRPADLARSLAEAFADVRVPWPVLNGFCYAVRAEVFDKLGGLDEAAFPRGYGEEVDLMLRSAGTGLRAVIVPASFVYHYKSRSLGAERAALTDASNLTLNARWGERLPEVVEAMDSSTEMASVRATFGELVDALVEGGL